MIKITWYQMKYRPESFFETSTSCNSPENLRNSSIFEMHQSLNRLRSPMVGTIVHVKIFFQIMQNDPNKMDEQLNKIFPISNSGGKWNVPFVRRFPYILLSISVIFTLGTASVLSVVGVTLYRLTMSTILSGLDTSDLITDNAVLIASATSVLINFACVQILNELFGR